MRWNNWSGRQRINADQIVFVRSEADAVGLVREVAISGKSIRAAGAGHSHAPLVINDELIVDCSGLAGVVSLDAEHAQADIRAGTSIYALGAPLNAAGLALKNQGDIDRQTLAGAISTGTHGTGQQLQNMSASVAGLRLVTGSGDLVACSASHHPDLFQVARLGVGAAGLITQVTMQLRAAVVLKEDGGERELSSFVDDIPELCASHERFEFFWYPGTDRAMVKVIGPVDSEPRYPIGVEGKRHAWSHEVLPSHRPHLHTEMEYSIPAEHGPACFAEIRRLLQQQFTGVKWPVEYRTVAQDDIWLSMASERDTVTISVHQDVNEDEETYYRACEEIFLSYGGRPHWGKVNYLNGAQFENCYPRWHDWWRIRDQYEPNQIFLNSYLRELHP